MKDREFYSVLLMTGLFFLLLNPLDHWIHHTAWRDVGRSEVDMASVLIAVWLNSWIYSRLKARLA